MSTTSRRKRSRTRGQSLVEFALVFPVFILILSGILDFGFLLFSRMTVINAAREGAREAVTADKANIPAEVVARMTAVWSPLTGVPAPTVTCVAIKSASCDLVAGGLPDPQAGDAVNVVITYQYRSFFPLLFGTTFNLSSNVQMVIE